MDNTSTTTDTLFAPLTIATAPESSKPMLEKVQKSVGFIPNLMAIFANNATVLEGISLGAVFEKGSFTPRERQSSYWLRVSRTTAEAPRRRLQK